MIETLNHVVAIASAIGAILTPIGAVVVIILQIRHGRALNGVHLEMNSMKDALVVASKAEGELKGAADERQRRLAKQSDL